MNKRDISTELWREYTWIIPETGRERKVLITEPQELYYEKGSSCHVVTTKAADGEIISFCVPSVGRFGCVLTWRGREDAADVTFVSASKEGGSQPEINES